ncbi:MAG: FG-GAP repeat domain-containing protein, partial [Planctomycetota bacterium]
MVNTRFLLLALCIPALAACRGNSSSHHGGGGGSGILDTVAYETRTELLAGLDQMVDACFEELNGDGIPDAIVIDLEGKLQILLGQGGGSFTPALATPLDIGGVGIAVRCDNVDSLLPESSPLPDIVVVSSDPDQVTVLVNDGQGGFEATAQFPTGVIPDGVILGECTGDNQPDLVVTHLSNSDVLLFPGLGNGTFGAGQPLFMPSGSRTSGLTYGDANHDDIPDVLICDIDNDRIILFPGLADPLGQPAGTHGGPIPIPAGLSPLDIALGDLDSDGLDDIAVTNFDSQTIDIKVHTGANQFLTVDSLQVDGRPALLHVDDVTGDGNNDIVTSVLSRSTVALFPGLNSGGFG